MSNFVDVGGQMLGPEQVVQLLWRYKRELEGLTPGGSEFVNDPEYCAQFVRNRQTHQHETIIRQQLKIKESSSTQGRK